MGVIQDLKFALRVLARKPLFTVVVIVTLALGIGANSAMFSIIHRLLFEPVDYPERDRIVALEEARQGGDFDEVAPRSFLDWQTQTRSFDGVVAVQGWDVSLTGHGDPEQVLGSQVSPGFFPIFGIAPALGRAFAADEVDGKNEKVVVLSHALWERRYGADPHLIGQTIQIGGASYTVIGVAPRSFRYPSFAEFWAPLTLTPEQRADRRSRYLGVVAHLKPGVSVDEANAEMVALGERHAREFPDSNGGRRTRAVGLVHSLTEEFTRDFIYILGGAALFVLLITCANVANVFLAHALARRREIAVRAALGAGRARVVRQLLTEAMLLGLAGGALSLLLAQWVVDLVKGAIPPTTTRFIAGWDRMGVDPIVLGFALGVGLVVGAIFGVLPALQVSRLDVGAALREGGRGATAGPRTQRLRSVLVVAQVALALTLLLAAGAMVKGFGRLAAGAFQPEGVLALRVRLPEERKDEEVLALQRAVVERLRALPGSTGAAVVNNIPFGSQNWTTGFTVEGRDLVPGEIPTTAFRPSSPGYLELLRVKRFEGRLLEPTDTRDSPRVAVVNETLAQRYWPGQSALGKRLHFSGQKEGEWTTIVGVVGSVEEFVDDRAPRPSVWVPMEQSVVHGLYFVVRTEGDPVALAPAARQAIWALAPDQPITSVATLPAARNEQLSGLRTGSAMMSGFAVMAALLAALGIYGVIATLVTQRTHEIGVRVALGAQRRHILQLVIGRGLVLAGVGALLGLAGGAALVGLLGKMLRNLIVSDPLLYVVVTVLVVGAAFLGSYIPARRAARVDPLRALRSE